MQIISFPWNAEEIRDDEGNLIGYSREYDAADFAGYFGTFFSNGVLPTPANHYKVTSAHNNMVITVEKGAGILEGIVHRSFESVEMRVTDSHNALSRMDSIILELNRLEKIIHVIYVSGVPSTNPVATALVRHTDMYQLRLAKILVKGGVVRITQADITDTRMDKDQCGFVYALHKDVDTTEIFNQYDTYLKLKQAAWAEIQSREEVNWQTQTIAQQSNFDGMLNRMLLMIANGETDIAALQSFDPDNYFELPGTKRLTAFKTDGSIFDQVKKELNDLLVMERLTEFLVDGGIRETVSLFEDDGITIHKKRVNITEFIENGDIEEVVSNVLE